MFPVSLSSLPWIILMGIKTARLCEHDRMLQARIEWRKGGFREKPKIKKKPKIERMRLALGQAAKGIYIYIYLNNATPRQLMDKPTPPFPVSEIFSNSPWHIAALCDHKRGKDLQHGQRLRSRVVYMAKACGDRLVCARRNGFAHDAGRGFG